MIKSIAITPLTHSLVKRVRAVNNHNGSAMRISRRRTTTTTTTTTNNLAVEESVSSVPMPLEFLDRKEYGKDQDHSRSMMPLSLPTMPTSIGFIQDVDEDLHLHLPDPDDLDLQIFANSKSTLSRRGLTATNGNAAGWNVDMVAIISVAAVVVLMLAGVVIFGLYLKWEARRFKQNYDDDTDMDTSVRTSPALELTSAQPQSELQSPQLPSLSPSPDEDEDENQLEMNEKIREERRLFILQNTTHTKFLSNKNDKASVSTSISERMSEESCPICHESYKKGDDTAWSKNETCHHSFHLRCISEWLLEHDDCPMCRAKYFGEGG